MAYRERQKISQMTPKGANLEATDLIEISELVSGSYVTKSITGLEIINAASGGITPDLQQVTDVGSTTTNSISVTIGVNEYSAVNALNVTTENIAADTHATIENTGTLLLKTGAEESSLKNTNVTNPSVVLEFPDKATGSYTIATTSDLTNGTVTSVDLTMPSAFTVSGNPITTAGTLAVSGAGTASQYVRGDGTLATLPSSGGGGSSVFYYLNGSVAASVATYNQMDFNAVIGAGTDFTLVGNGLIAQFLTDAGNPNRLLIPGGAWNFEMFFSMSSTGGLQKFYVELLKYDGATFTSIASTSTNPEAITGGTTTDLYITSLAVPSTVLLATDRLAVRVYIIDSSGGRTATLHTEDNNLCQIITTFAGGVSSLNGLTANTQNFAVGTTGTDFNISSVTDIHTFNLPTASATNRGALSTTDWSAFNGKASYTPRVQSVTSAATVTPVNTNDLVKITAQAAALALTNPTGTWDEGQPLMIRIKDNGTARAITYDTNYRAIGVTLPTTTVISKTTYLGLIYNSTDTKFDVIGVTTQA